MKRNYFLAFLLIASCLVIAKAEAQVIVGGITLSETKNYEGKNLVLNGTGVRTKFFMDLYVGSLYLQEKNSNAKELVKSGEEMAIHLDIISGLITSDKMTSATLDGFENSTGGNMASIQKEVDQFMGVFTDKINKGDSFDFVNTSEGVKVFKNGKALVTVEGQAFKEALFGIWLGDKPADKKLKKGLLGEK
ncbi:chalcone isomerase family protein [Xanthovirga aplysinae]|uniref:chalcone isomerase family protein n=1 Tax=Xanthovirga aplysinae TaxID=2529853 RepID=UPI0012BBF330|nr:chalcone isomerase family protein [Xanthovirga aplysinae]MTI33521.1 chalcone isomerase [Xanthovirga aplysinae]